MYLFRFKIIHGVLLNIESYPTVEFFVMVNVASSSDCGTLIFLLMIICLGFNI